MAYHSLYRLLRFWVKCTVRHSSVVEVWFYGWEMFHFLCNNSTRSSIPSVVCLLCCPRFPSVFLRGQSNSTSEPVAVPLFCIPALLLFFLRLFTETFLFHLLCSWNSSFDFACSSSRVHLFLNGFLRKGATSLYIAPCLHNAYIALTSRPLPCLPASSTQCHFHLRKTKCELTVLLLLGQCALALFLLWRPDDWRLCHLMLFKWH
jgi:hypothetical protein